MELAHRVGLRRRATGFDQEAIATLVQTGCYLGFLPDHYAQPFVAAGRMRAVSPDTLGYDCSFACIYRGWRH
jgi:DNA-binding transcriptional LysR family regulator